METDLSNRSSVSLQKEVDPHPWATFLEASPPNQAVRVTSCVTILGTRVVVATPDLQLHCDSDICAGLRVFHSDDEIGSRITHTFFVNYRCRNCQKSHKTFAIRLVRESVSSFDGLAVKFGELPTFGPPVPARVITLIGPDREMFLRGRQAENLGLGIGAFAYYRRVVENQKGRFIAEISRVAQRLGAEPSVVQRFDAAANEVQFSKALHMIKDAIPPVLMISGHNPLSLLHSALSGGIHAQSDEECLELAGHIRVVLTELADRISQALRDQNELKSAVKRLLSRDPGSA